VGLGSSLLPPSYPLSIEQRLLAVGSSAIRFLPWNREFGSVGAKDTRMRMERPTTLARTGFSISRDCSFYFSAGGDGRLCPTVVVSGWTGVRDAVRSLNMPMDAIPTISATTAKKKITLPSVERAGPELGSCGA
jgi:hypothetical protein